MLHRTVRQFLLWGLATALGVSLLPGESRGGGSLSVHAGYDLFAAGPGTSFPGLGELEGVPFNSFNFSAGLVPVGNTDTVVQRLSDVSVMAVGDTEMTQLEMVALQLRTVGPIDFGNFGVDSYFVTLQSARGGPATMGSLSITFLSQENGTTSSFFDVFFDIRKGSLTGPIVYSDELTLSNDGAAWGRDPPPGAVVIPGVNSLLNGRDNSEDFWPVTPFLESHPSGATYVAMTSTPEPSTWLMGTTALVVGLAYSRTRQARAGRTAENASG
jgi:hypothetical protein